MTDLAQIWDAVKAMRSNRLKNYIVPGLHSSLIGAASDYGKVRLFEAERYTRDTVTPHSHRFGFTCLVLHGAVENTIYETAIAPYSAEMWIRSTVTQVCGKNGLQEFKHVREEEPRFFKATSTVYRAGDTYRLRHTDIHSIVFEKDTKVLFFEEPSVQDWDWMLEPFVEGKLVPTFKTEPWMFEKE